MNLFLNKNLSGVSAEITFDSIVADRVILENQYSAWIEIDDLVGNWQSDDVRASNAREFLGQLRFTLIPYCGYPEFLGKDHLQDLTISNNSGKVSASIFWRVHDVSYLTGISTSLNEHEDLSLFARLDGAESMFVIPDHGAMVKIAIKQISLTFK